MVTNVFKPNEIAAVGDADLPSHRPSPSRAGGEKTHRSVRAEGRRAAPTAGLNGVVRSQRFDLLEQIGQDVRRSLLARSQEPHILCHLPHQSGRILGVQLLRPVHQDLLGAEDVEERSSLRHEQREEDPHDASVGGCPSVRGFGCGDLDLQALRRTALAERDGIPAVTLASGKLALDEVRVRSRDNWMASWI